MKKLEDLKPGDLVKYIGGSNSKYLIKGKYYEFKRYRKTDIWGKKYDKIRIRDERGKFTNKHRGWFEINVPNNFFYEFNLNRMLKKSKVKTPKYYDGYNDYTAKEVVDNFNLNYHLGTACTYILRAYKKHDNPNEDIQKAIDHLTFELERIEYINQYNRNRDFKDHIITGTE
jgi:hypothetical protein